jgi:hypothetical protein
MACNLCTPHGWDNVTCSFCGIHQEGKAYMLINVYVGDEDESEYPYAETVVCKKCFDEFGAKKLVKIAIENAEDIRENWIESTSIFTSESMNCEVPEGQNMNKIFKGGLGKKDLEKLADSMLALDKERRGGRTMDENKIKREIKKLML